MTAESCRGGMSAAGFTGNTPVEYEGVDAICGTYDVVGKGCGGKRVGFGV